MATFNLLIIASVCMISFCHGVSHKCLHTDLRSGKLNSENKFYNHSVIQNVSYRDHPFHKAAGHIHPAILRSQGSPSYENLRVFVDTSQITLQDAVKREFILHFLVPNAVSWLEKALKVIPVNGRLRLDKRGGPKSLYVSHCGDAEIPEAHSIYGRGVEADFILYVTTQSTDFGTLAYSSACREDQYNRPIAGNINFNPVKVRVGIENREDQLATITHEILHTLGFSFASYGNFRNEFGRVRGFSNVLRMVKGKQYIVTPAVVKWVRSQFDCPDLVGAELENQGGYGTVGSHWEKRMFMTELMTASSTLNPIYSGLTLALMEDSGWYKADFSYAQPLDWGYKAGCKFVREKCIQNDKAIDKRFFCEKDGTSGCTFDRMAKGYCSITKQKGIPRDNQYFDDGDIGGLDLADYCPIMAYYQVAGTNRTTDCRQPKNAPQPGFYGEEYCVNCRCFETDHLITDGYDTKIAAACYDHKCDFENNVLSVKLDHIWLECPFEGGSIAPPDGFEGKLICPAFEDMCASRISLTRCPNRCSGRGNCFQGQCFCIPGWQSDDCSHEICPDRCFVDLGQGGCDSSTSPPSCKCKPGFLEPNCRPANDSVVVDPPKGALMYLNRTAVVANPPTLHTRSHANAVFFSVLAGAGLVIVVALGMVCFSAFSHRRVKKIDVVQPPPVELTPL